MVFPMVDTNSLIVSGSFTQLLNIEKKKKNKKKKQLDERME